MLSPDDPQVLLSHCQSGLDFAQFLSPNKKVQITQNNDKVTFHFKGNKKNGLHTESYTQRKFSVDELGLTPQLYVATLQGQGKLYCSLICVFYDDQDVKLSYCYCPANQPTAVAIPAETEYVAIGLRLKGAGSFTLERVALSTVKEYRKQLLPILGQLLLAGLCGLDFSMCVIPNANVHIEREANSAVFRPVGVSALEKQAYVYLNRDFTLAELGLTSGTPAATSSADQNVTGHVSPLRFAALRGEGDLDARLVLVFLDAKDDKLSFAMCPSGTIVPITPPASTQHVRVALRLSGAGSYRLRQVALLDAQQYREELLPTLGERLAAGISGADMASCLTPRKELCVTFEQNRAQFRCAAASFTGSRLFAHVDRAFTPAELGLDKEMRLAMTGEGDLACCLMFVFVDAQNTHVSACICPANASVVVTPPANAAHVSLGLSFSGAGSFTLQAVKFSPVGTVEPGAGDRDVTKSVAAQPSSPETAKASGTAKGTSTADSAVAQSGRAAQAAVPARGEEASAASAQAQNAKGKIPADVLQSVPGPVKTVLFAGHNFHFIQPYIDYLQQQPQYKVLLDVWKSHSIHDSAESQRLLSLADVIFCEWGLGNAVWYSQNLRAGQRCVVRMHRQEIDTVYPEQFAYPQIHKIIAITPYMQQAFLNKFHMDPEKITTIWNIMQTDVMSTEKAEGYIYRLGMVGIIPLLKRVDLAIALTEYLCQRNRRFVLHVKSKMPADFPWMKRRTEENIYYAALMDDLRHSPMRNHVVFEPYGQDMPQFFQKIGWIVSCSDFEGSHQVVGEGMAAGCVPLIRHWAGAETVYPGQYLFEDIPSMAAYVLSNLAHDQREDVRKYTEQFASHIIFQQLDELLFA